VWVTALIPFQGFHVSRSDAAKLISIALLASKTAVSCLSKTSDYEKMVRPRLESWLAALVGLPQLSLETNLSPMARSDELQENTMLVGYARSTRGRKLI
jgi:hypothetical protein